MRNTIKEMLRGIEPGDAQIVGNMSVIPLVSEIVDETIASPNVLELETKDYGTVIAYNTGTKQESGLTISPVGNMVMTRQAAQNHAIPGMKIIKKGKKVRFDTAACVQQGQGGYIRKGRYRLMLLPLAIREDALRSRKTRGYDKLWGSICRFNESLGLHSAGHLEYFVRQFRKEMDEFVAQFEVVPNQVGAIVLIDGQVVGMERCPNYAYFRAMWEPMIRECYGSMSIQAAKKNRYRIPKNRVALSAKGVIDLSGIRKALEKAKKEEYRRVRQAINGFVDETFKREKEERVGDYTVFTLDGTQFTGQMVQKNRVPLMFSLVKTRNWLNDPNRERFEMADAFGM